MFLVYVAADDEFTTIVCDDVLKPYYNTLDEAKQAIHDQLINNYNVYDYRYNNDEEVATYYVLETDTKKVKTCPAICVTRIEVDFN